MGKNCQKWDWPDKYFVTNHLFSGVEKSKKSVPPIDLRSTIFVQHGRSRVVVPVTVTLKTEVDSALETTLKSRMIDFLQAGMGRNCNLNNHCNFPTCTF